MQRRRARGRESAGATTEGPRPRGTEQRSRPRSAGETRPTCGRKPGPGWRAGQGPGGQGRVLCVLRGGGGRLRGGHGKSYWGREGIWEERPKQQLLRLQPRTFHMNARIWWDCVCVRACALVFGARIYINVNLSLCISSRRPFRYKLPVLPSSQSPISTGKSVSPTFLRSLSRCFKDHCPLLLSF